MSSSSASLKSRAHAHDSDAGDIPLIPLNPTYPANPTLKIVAFLRARGRPERAQRQDAIHDSGEKCALRRPGRAGTAAPADHVGGAGYSVAVWIGASGWKAWKAKAKAMS